MVSTAKAVRPDPLFLALDGDLVVSEAIGDSTRLYPELPRLAAGAALAEFIAARINAGYLGLNEVRGLRTQPAVETRLLELRSYPLFRTYQVSPRGEVLSASHTRIDEDLTLVTVARTRMRVEPAGGDRFRRAASLLHVNLEASGLSGFGLIEHLANDIIDTLAVPLAVLNGAGLVLAANAAARRVFGKGRLRVSEHDRLEVDGVDTEEVLKALRAVEVGQVAPLTQFSRLALRYARAIQTPPLGKVFVVALDDDGDAETLAELLRQRYPALTASEVRIGLLLLAGHSPKRIAQDRDASIHTVRTQVASILRKTNCHSVQSFLSMSRVTLF